MSIPLLSGPGCLTVTILLFSQTPTLSGTFSLVLAVLAIYGFTHLALSSANRVKDLIGRTGDDILRRLLGVILAALAIQFIADGVRQIMIG